MTVLKFVARTAGSSVFVSGDSVGVARVWKEEGGKVSCCARRGVELQLTSLRSGRRMRS